MPFPLAEMVAPVTSQTTPATRGLRAYGPISTAFRFGAITQGKSRWDTAIHLRADRLEIGKRHPKKLTLLIADFETVRP